VYPPGMNVYPHTRPSLILVLLIQVAIGCIFTAAHNPVIAAMYGQMKR
jgi:hypothetical protein